MSKYLSNKQRALMFNWIPFFKGMTEEQWQSGFIKLTKKFHQKTTLPDGLVRLTNLLNDWTDNLNKNITQKDNVVKLRLSSSKRKQHGVDLPGIEPGRLGLSVQSSKPARPTPVLFYHNHWQAGFIKLTKKSLVIGLAAWLIVISSGLYFLMRPQTASAAWFDDNWAYRKAITLTDTAAETNKYATLSSYNASDTTKYQSDCGDVRFTDQGGNLLTYTVSNCGASTTFHINIPSILNGTQTIYIYYGNPAVQNGFVSADPDSACATCTFGTPGSETKGPGPSAYWKFDDGQGTNAQDSTTNNNDGTLSGTTKPTWQTEDQCISGKCLYFDGTTSNVTVANAITGVQTVSMWIKPNTLTSALIDLDGGTHKITVNSSGVVSATGFTSPTIYVNGVVASTLTANTWQYITVTTGTSFNSTSSLTIGKSSTTFLKGFIDEVKIYPYARSAAQILADYNARGTSKGAGAVLGGASNNNYSSSAARSLSNGLVGYWKMDESSWNGTSGEVKDASGNGNNGTAQGSATTASGKFGNGGTFSGVDQNVNILYSLINNSTPTFTYSFWVKANNSGDGTQYILGHASSSINNNSCHAILYVPSTTKIYALTNQPNASGQTILYTYNLNSWTHLVITNDPTNNRSVLYINGTQVGSGVKSPCLQDLGAQFRIGRHPYSGYNLDFNGSIDEVRIYNRALSPNEVSQLYNFAPGPRVELKMEEGSGTTANDTSGNSNTGTVNTGTWTQGKYGKGVNLNGTSGSDVSVPDFAY